MVVHAPLKQFDEGKRREPGAPTSSGTVAISLIGIAACGAVAWFVYAISAWSGCHSETDLFPVKTGGAASGDSLRVAAIVGGCAWLVVALIGFRFRPKVRYLFISFVVLCAMALVVLWNLSPLSTSAFRNRHLQVGLIPARPIRTA
jgi:hypothetical protein